MTAFAAYGSQVYGLFSGGTPRHSLDIEKDGDKHEKPEEPKQVPSGYVAGGLVFSILYTAKAKNLLKFK